MGWSSGVNYRGETVGYGHPGVCNEPGCDEKIDLGLGYTCGGLDGVDGEDGCGRHFCSKHLFYTMEDDGHDHLCGHCIARVDEGLPVGMEDTSW